jgi:hypothetical protein
MLFADSASISSLPRFLYIWMSSANPSFHDAFEESSCVTSMFFNLGGCAVLVFLVQRLEFVGLLFSDEIFGIFNHSINIRVSSDQLSFVIHTRPTPNPVSRAQCATFKGIWYPSHTKLLFLLCPEWDCSLVPTRS